MTLLTAVIRRLRFISEKFRQDEGGAILVYAALSMVVLVGAVGLVVDLGFETITYKRVQIATDAAVLAAAQAVSSGSSIATATTWASAIASQNLGTTVTVSPIYLDSAGNSTSTPSSVVTVTATLTRTVPVTLAAVVGASNTIVSTSANATLASLSGTSCVICVMNPSVGQALKIAGSSASITSAGGSILVNSNGNNSISSNGTLSATGSGSIIGSVSAATCSLCSPAPQIISPFLDPHRFVPTPSLAGLGSVKTVTNGATQTLSPGYYDSFAPTSGTFTLNSGIYVISNSFAPRSTATVIGTSGVMFYFTCGGPTSPAACLNTGQSGGFASVSGGSLNLVSQTSGPYQGVLFYYDRHNTHSLDMDFSGGPTLKGTAYAIASTWKISGNSSAGLVDAMIVVDMLETNGNSVLTTNYAAADNYHALLRSVLWRN